MADPGDLASLAADGITALGLVNSTTLAQNLFLPSVNTGNGNTFWITNIPLTPVAGPTVSVSDITFDYWAANSSAVQNVDRRSDFLVTLFSPSSVVLGSASVNDVLNGTNTTPNVGTPVQLTFSSPIALTAVGTYTLRIQAGDFAGFNETGTFTAINNLSINAVPEPSSLALITLGGIALLRRRRA